jgi:hypothetical protein
MSISRLFMLPEEGLLGGDVSALVEQLPEDFRQRVKLRLSELDGYIAAGLVPVDSFRDRPVVDWEAGDAAFSVAFLIRGARHVFAIDTWMNLDQIPEPLKACQQLTIRKASIRQFSHEAHSSAALVFSNTVTEHLQELRNVYQILGPGGAFFTNHDNYYQPVGSHDHGFLYYGRWRHIERVCPACWLDAKKCEASAAYRDEIRQKLPWTWDERNERSLNSANCADCHYYMRAQPWAHLIFQDRFHSVFPQVSFHTGVDGASLNKITPFQLRQYILEAGFCIEKSERAFVKNKPPAELCRQIPIADLQTTMVRILARKQ